MGAKLLQANMSHGAITPLMHARADSELYQAGLAVARNWIVLRYGGVTRAPGTLYKGALRYPDKQTYMIPFKFKRSQVYAIEAGDLYFRFWTRTGRIESPPGTPVTVATPYAEADLPKIQVRQLGDVVYIVCDGYPPKTLTRNSETSWTLADYAVKFGPYLPVNTSDTTLTPSWVGSVTLAMTSNTTPSGTVTSGDASADAYKVFDRDKSTYYKIGATTAVLTYAFSGGATKVADAYWIKAIGFGGPVAPTVWDFQGFNGTSWVTLDSRQSETGWLRGESRFYSFVNETAFEQYRLNIASSESEANLYIAEIAIHERAENQTPFDLTASSTVGINDGAGFQAEDVGRFVRLLGSDGKWRDAKITDYTSDTVVKIVLYGQVLPDFFAIANWQLGAWGSIPGYPRAIGIRDDRIVFGGTPTDPLGVWATRQADYDNMGTSDPLELDDALSERLTGGELNEIQWFADGQDIIAGTAGSIRAIGTADNSKAFGPGNVRQLGQTPVTTGIVPGFEIENMLVFLDLYGRRLFEAAYSNVPDAYVAHEVSALHEHLFLVGVTRLVYQGVPNRMLWGVTSDGNLLAITYDRDQKVFGVGMRDVDGTVMDVLSLPGDDADDLFVTVVRTINGVATGCMELLGPFYREAIHGYPVYLDSAMVYEGAAANVISGLDRFYRAATAEEDLTKVGVWGDGKDFGDFAVDSDGHLTLPFGIAVEKAVIGIRLGNCRVESLRPGNFGAQDGASLGRKGRIANARIDLFETQGLRVGTLEITDELTYEGQSEIDPFGPQPLLTGSFPYPAEDSFANSGVFVFETDSAYPATVRAVLFDVEGEP